jgi:arginyl-tRNA synthetase
MQIVKDVKKKPREIAEMIKKRLENNNPKFIEKIEVAGPGFLNFFFSKSSFVEKAKEIVSKDVFLPQVYKAKNVIIEFTDPNPFKIIHIGHLYSNTVGESLCQIYEALGAEIRRADYFGDVGMHVAKSIWGFIQKLEEEIIEFETVQKKDLKTRMQFLGDAYAKGATAYKEDEDAQKEIKGINKQVFISAQDFYRERYGKEPNIDYTEVEAETKYDFALVDEIYKHGRAWSLKYFDKIYERVGMSFDLYYPESVAGEIGIKYVEKAVQKGIFEVSEGAVVYPEEKNGLHTRVFVNSLGLPTYEAKELGLAPTKYEDFKYDKSIIITGDEIDEYFKVLLSALEKLNPELGNKTTHISHGMVRLPEGKMSSRTGNVITAEWLLNEAKDRVEEKIETDDYADDELAEIIGQASIKYAFLKQSIKGDMAFSFEESINFDGNSGPYLQYTYARTTSLLAKTDRDITDVKVTIDKLDEIELNVIKKVSQFNDSVVKAAEKNAPHILCANLYEIAQSFNKFYGEHQIITEEQKLHDNRLFITAVVRKVLKKGLSLLNIHAPEEM